MDCCNKKNWHEAANLFPLLSDADLQELADDIRAHGLLNPVVLCDGLVLDGRNRAAACKIAGVNPSVVEWVPNGLSPLVWVISQNLRRRHLEVGQRAAVAVEAQPLLAKELAENKKRTQAGSKMIPPINKGLTGRASEHVAKRFDVSRGYVVAAQKIKNIDERVFQQVKSGSLSIPEAERVLGFKQSTLAMVSADDNEWYTPENYIKAARKVLGRFDLDPASCKIADKVVKAERFYTKEQDGLTKKWSGVVWLNPPYGDVGPKFVAKLLHEHKAGNVPEAILLVNSHCTDAKWFKPLFRYTLCFTDHRSKFWTKDGVGGAPTHGSVFIYFGENQSVFAYVFEQFGSIVTRYPTK